MAGPELPYTVPYVDARGPQEDGDIRYVNSYQGVPGIYDTSRGMRDWNNQNNGTSRANGALRRGDPV